MCKKVRMLQAKRGGHEKGQIGKGICFGSRVCEGISHLPFLAANAADSYQSMEGTGPDFILSMPY